MALTVGRAKLRIHPLALMFPLAAVMLGAGQEAAALGIALIFHEGAHLLAARGLGVGVSQLRLMPFGGAIAMDNPYALAPSRLLAVAAAGPLGSALALLCAAALAHWRALPPLFATTLMRVNLTLMLFNLLPALPLDGGRMLYALLSPKLGRERATEAGIWIGRIVAVALVVVAVRGLLIGGRLNLSLIFAAVFILSSAGDERRALSDTRVRTMLSELKPLNKPVPARLWAVSSSCDVETALRAARPDALTLYAVYDDSRLACITDDRRLLEAALRQGMTTEVRAAMP